VLDVHTSSIHTRSAGLPKSERSALEGAAHKSVVAALASGESPVCTELQAALAFKSVSSNILRNVVLNQASSSVCLVLNQASSGIWVYAYCLKV
jgi:hypothetical protein